MIERKNYLDRIKPFIDKDIIKVLTGIRRCGKSVMLKLIKEELIKNGRSKEQFITLNFENLKNKPYCTVQALNDYILERAKLNQKNYIFLDEIQEVEEWEKCINSFESR